MASGNRVARGTVSTGKGGDEVLATGQATMSQLGTLFSVDPKSLPRKLLGLPVFRRGPLVLYNVGEAAGRIVKPSYEIENFIKRMHHSDLPPMLGKEFWNAQKARQSYEEAQGDLWRTEAVVSAFAELFSTLRMTLLLIADSLERETSLTDQQRAIVRGQIDGAIKEMRETVTGMFKDYDYSYDLERPPERGDEVPSPEEDTQDPDGL